MIIDQIASQPFTLDGKSLSPVLDFATKRRRELRKLFYTPKRKPVPEPIVEPAKDLPMLAFPKSWIAQLPWRLEAAHIQSVSSVTPDKAKLEIIKMEVSFKHQVSISDMESKSRKQPIVKARHEAYFRGFNETNMSLSGLGVAFGGAHHSTVYHAITKHKKIGLQQ